MKTRKNILWANFCNCVSKAHLKALKRQHWLSSFCFFYNHLLAFKAFGSVRPRLTSLFQECSLTGIDIMDRNWIKLLSQRNRVWWVWVFSPSALLLTLLFWLLHLALDNTAIQIFFIFFSRICVTDQWRQGSDLVPFFGSGSLSATFYGTHDLTTSSFLWRYSASYYSPVNHLD